MQMENIFIFLKTIKPQSVLTFLSVLTTVVVSVAFSADPIWFITAFAISSITILFLLRPVWISYFLVVLMNMTYLIIKTPFFYDNSILMSAIMLPDYFLLFTPLLWLLSRLIGSSKQYTGTSIDLLLLAFVFLASFSLLWSHDYSTGKVHLLKLFVSIFGTFVVAISTLTSRKYFRGLLWLVFTIGIINSTICFFSVLTYPSYSKANILDIGSLHVNLIFVDEKAVGNRGHGFSHPLTTASWLVTSIYMSIALFLTTPSKKRRVLIGLMAAFMLAALMTTMSKGPLIAFFISLTMMFYFLKPLRNKIFTAVSVLVVCVIIAFIIGNSSNINKLINLTGRQLSTEDSNTSTSSRLDWWGTTLNKGFDTNGVGVGIGGLKQYLSKQAMHPHNTYISAFGELGLLGFVLILSIYFTAFASYWRSLRQCNNEYYRRVLLVYIAGYGATLMSIFVNYGYTNTATWWYMGIGFVLTQIASDQPPDRHEELLPYYKKDMSLVADHF
jgi:O-antigen ligase